MRKLYFLFGIIFISSILFGCGTSSSSVTNKNEGEFKPSVTVQKDEKLEIIADKLMNEYLNHYTENNIKEVDKIKAFKIDDIKVQKKDKDGFVFAVSFSVEPVAKDSYWFAGNGTIKDDGWVYGKFLFVTVKQNGNTYTMTEWGTGR
ncbi:MAG: hypothetical protein ACPL3A_04005 [Thermoanaerobacteraceae bacterium]